MHMKKTCINALVNVHSMDADSARVQYSLAPPKTGGGVERCTGSTTRFEDDEEERLAFSSFRLGIKI